MVVMYWTKKLMYKSVTAKVGSVTTITKGHLAVVEVVVTEEVGDMCNVRVLRLYIRIIRFA